MKTETLMQAFSEMMKQVGTSITGHVLSFDPSSQLAQLQVGVLGEDSKGNSIKYDPIIECPIQFPGGSAFSLEFEIKPGAEGLIVFSQRCLEAWIQTGGIAQNPIARFHDINDACFIPGIRSKPNALSGFANDGIRIRNKDASDYVWLKSDGSLSIKTTANVDINGATITSDGKISDSDGIELGNHVHESGTYKVGSNDVTGQSGEPV